MQRFIFEREKLGTLFRIVVIAEKESDIRMYVEKAFDEVDRIEKSYSRFLQNNELFKLNRSIDRWFCVSDELFELIKFGEKLKSETNGAFDLTVKSVLEAFGYDERYSFVEKGRGALGHIELGAGNMVKISAGLDLGALGKGYVVDKVREILDELDDFCINAGGDIYVKGSDGECDGWKILFEDPADATRAIGFTVASDMAFGSSNALRRSWGDKSHLINARKAAPADEMLAVYTQAKTCLLADAYSTALFVLGFEEAQKLVEKLSVEAMLISQKGDIFKTAGFQGELFGG